MVWVCFTHDGGGPFVDVEGTMTAAVYQEIMANKVLPYWNAKEAESDGFFILQDDNAPAHRAHFLAEYFGRKRQNKVVQAGKFTGFKSIENLWAILKRRLGN